jgi:hypothetical protein
MSKRLIVTENEKKEIKSKYNIQEDWLSDIIGKVKETGSNVVDFFKGVSDEKEIDSVDDVVSVLKNAGTKVKKKIEDKAKELKSKVTTKDDESDDESLEIPSGKKTLTAMSLYKKINSELNNPSLSAALVANAQSESNFKCDAYGDGGSYAMNKPNAITINDKKYCSFGLWQFNICGGLGIELLEFYGKKLSKPEEKLEILTNCEKQIEFMCSYIKKKTANEENRNAVEWVAYIVKEVERPSNIYGAIVKRSKYLVNNITSIVPSYDMDEIS